MSDPRGDKLFVNVGASQARRRLKGFGHGVRKVQSAGSHQAVIIHTATGRHLAELEAQFADVGFSRTDSDLRGPIDNLRNIGSASADRLRNVGIRTISDLERLGPARAYRLIRRHHPEASLNLLWSLAAGLSGLDWRDLPAEQKERLLAEVEGE